MKIEQLIELCKWDYLTFDEAMSASPDGRDHFMVREPGNFAKNIYRVRIQNEPFGLYSWMPEHPGDRARVLEHKVDTNLRYPKYTPKEPELVEFVCQAFKECFKEIQLTVGVACVGRMDSDYVMVFAKTESTPLFQLNFALCPISLKYLEPPSQMAYDYLGLIAKDLNYAYQRALSELR